MTVEELILAEMRSNGTRLADIEVRLEGIWGELIGLKLSLAAWDGKSLDGLQSALCSWSGRDHSPNHVKEATR